MSTPLCRAAGNAVYFICPACTEREGRNAVHRITVPPWTWNGSLEKPTIRASVKVGLNCDGGDPFRECCHSFVTDGRIEYCGDSVAHPGETLDLPPWLTEE